MRNNYQARCAMMEPYIRIIKATHQEVIDFLYRRKVRNRCSYYDINIIKGEIAKLHVKALPFRQLNKLGQHPWLLGPFQSVR